MAKGKGKRYVNIGSERPKQAPIAIHDVEKFRAFTIKFGGLINRIITPIGLTVAFDPDDYKNKKMPDVIQKQALWDTGATASVITVATARELKLIPVGTTSVRHAGGTSISNTYLVNFYLPNNVAIAGVLVSEFDDVAGNFGVIIGMDIISGGDFSITNMDGKTHMSFRTPSIKSIDYVEEHTRLYGHK